MLKKEIISNLNPLTFPLLRKELAEDILSHTLDFLNDKNNCVEDRQEVFHSFSAHITSHYENVDFLLNFQELFRSESDFLVINLLKNDSYPFDIKEDVFKNIFEFYRYKAPVLNLFNSSIYNKTTISKEGIKIPLWEWIHHKTNGVFFTSKLDNFENKNNFDRHLYNNYYYNTNNVDKYLLFLSCINILLSNFLFDKDDNNLQTLGNLYFEKKQGYYSHLNDNFMTNIYFPDNKKQVIYAELFSLTYNDFYIHFKKNNYMLTSEFAKHIISINQNVNSHTDSLKVSLISNLERDFLKNISKGIWDNLPNKKKRF